MKIRSASFFVWLLLMIVVGDFLYLNFIWKPKPSEYSNWFGEKAVIFGRVAEDPEIAGSDMRIVVLPDGRGYSQRIFATVRKRNEFRYGDKIILIGKLKEPVNPPDFDYRDYLLAHGISAQSYYPEVYILARSNGGGLWDFVKARILALKRLLFDRTRRTLPGEPGNLLIAMLSGDKEYLSKNTKDSFNNIGAAHMIAVSGYKLTLIFVYLEALRNYLGKRFINILSALCAIFYSVSAGFAPAVLRAVLMSGLYALARERGRDYQQLRALLFAAAVLIVINPLVLKFDLGFVLSFSGILGIVLLVPILNNVLNKLPFKIPEPFGLREIFLSSTAAQIVTLPIMVYYFHSFPLVAPIANLLLMPLLAPVILIGYSCVLPFAGKYISLVLSPALKYLLTISAWLSVQKISYFPARLNSAELTAIYITEALLYLAVSGYFNRLKAKREFAKMNAQNL